MSQSSRAIDQEACGLSGRTRWLSAAALLGILFLMYSSTFFTDYLMRDEWTGIGNRARALAAMRWSYNTYGRGLFGLYQKWVYDFVGFNPARIEFVRFVNFLSLALIAIVLLWFMQARTRHKTLAFFAVLFFMSQPALQSLMGYSLQLISNTLPSIWLSLLAFLLYFGPLQRSRFPLAVQIAIVFLILVLAMQSTQTYAFFATIPLAFLALAEWNANRRRIIVFLAIAVAVLVLSTVVYKVSLGYLHAAGGQGYALGEQGMAALTKAPLSVIAMALDPQAYWSAFKVWTYPYPFNNIRPLGEARQQTFAMAMMVVWAALLVAAMVLESRSLAEGKRRLVLDKWVAVAVCFGLAAVFVIADSPSAIVDHRPHVLVTYSGLIVVTGTYALGLLVSRYSILRSRPMSWIGAALVLLIALGAGSDTLRSLVSPHEAQLDYVRSVLRSKDPAQYWDVIVVLPSVPDVCAAEPCGPWFGETNIDPAHAREPAGYQYAMATAGLKPNKKLIFVQERPAAASEDAVLLNWNAYLSLRLRALGLSN